MKKVTFIIIMMVIITIANILLYVYNKTMLHKLEDLRAFMVIDSPVEEFVDEYEEANKSNLQVFEQDENSSIGLDVQRCALSFSKALKRFEEAYAHDTTTSARDFFKENLSISEDIQQQLWVAQDSFAIVMKNYLETSEKDALLS